MANYPISYATAVERLCRQRPRRVVQKGRRGIPSVKLVHCDLHNGICLVWRGKHIGTYHPDNTYTARVNCGLPPHYWLGQRMLAPVRAVRNQVSLHSCRGSWFIGLSVIGRKPPWTRGRIRPRHVLRFGLLSGKFLNAEVLRPLRPHPRASHKPMCQCVGCAVWEQDWQRRKMVMTGWNAPLHPEERGYMALGGPNGI